MSIIIQPKWKIRRGYYIFNFYGRSWENVRKNSTYDPISGVYKLNIPQELRDLINADPLCNPLHKDHF